MSVRTMSTAYRGGTRGTGTTPKTGGTGRGVPRGKKKKGSNNKKTGRKY